MAAWVACALAAWFAAACWQLLTARAFNARSVARGAHLATCERRDALLLTRAGAAALCLAPGAPVLFVIAHPDDESMCAALLATLGAQPPLTTNDAAGSSRPLSPR